MSDGDFQTTDSISEVTNNTGVTIDGVLVGSNPESFEITFPPNWMDLEDLQSRPVRGSRRGAGIREQMEDQSESTGIRWMNMNEYEVGVTVNGTSFSDYRVDSLVQTGNTYAAGTISPTEGSHFIAPLTGEVLTEERLRGIIEDLSMLVPTTTTPFYDTDHMTPELRQHMEGEIERNRRLIYGPAMVPSTPVHIESPEHYNFQIAVETKPYKDILDENLKQHWRIRGEH